jgi:hypothetical protein
VSGGADPGVATAVLTAGLAIVYLGLAFLNVRRGRRGIAAARFFAALLFGGVAVYLSVVELKLF